MLAALQSLIRKQPMTPPRHQSRTRLTLEILEDRCLMATRIWDGGAVSNNWTNANNWANNIAPVAGDDLVFPSNIADKVTDNNFADGTLFRSITVHGGYTLRGNKILLGEGGIVSSGSSNVINNDLSLGAGVDRAFNVNAGSTLFVDGRIEGGNGLVKTGAGDLALRANSSYTGLTDIAAGRLFITRDEALGAFSGAGTATLIRGGATLVLNDDLPASVLRVDERITVENGGTIHALNDVEQRGIIVTNGTATLRHDGSVIERLLITGQISGPGGITVANGSGQVWLRGTQSNVQEGPTFVLGKVRLDNSAGNAIAGDLTIQSSGSVRLDRDHQLHDSSTVTILGTGALLANEREDTFHALRMQGGLLDGNRLDLVDFLARTPVYRNFFEDETLSRFQVNQLEATSSSSTTSAQILDARVFLTSATGAAVVTDGPAFNDLVIRGPVGGFNGITTVLTLDGNGTTIVQDVPRLRYFVNGGLLRINAFERNGTDLVFTEVSIEVRSGGRFAGDADIGELLVRSGGRVRPGPLSSTGTLTVHGDLVLEPGAVLEVTLNNSTAGSGHDRIRVVQDDAVVGGAILQATLGPSTFVGQSFTIISIGTSFDGIVGSFFVPPESAPFILAQPFSQRLSLNYFGDLVVTIANTPPKAPGLVLNTTAIDEGGIVTATGALVDPDPRDQLRLYVNWGDGSPVQLVRPGRANFTLRHRYLQDGQYTARFTWIDQTGQGNSRDFNITVHNVPPTLSVALLPDRAVGAMLLGGLVRDGGRDTVRVTVDFGDGSPQVMAKPSGLGYFWLQHRYQAPGTYEVTITARDHQGAETTLRRSVNVFATLGGLLVVPTFGT